MSLYTDLAAGFPADPATPALIGGEGETLLTYGALEATSARVAALLADLGVRPGDRVAVQVEKSVAAVPLYLGVLRAGAVYLPLNMAYQPAELSYFLGDAEPSLMVGAPERAETLRTLLPAAVPLLTLDAQGQGTLTEALAGQPANVGTYPAGPQDLAAILYTSGTTGRSKGAMITHGNLASNARALVELWGFTAADVLLHALPLFHVHGLFVALNTALMAGCRILYLPKFDGAQVVRLLPRVTAMMGVPTFYTRLLEQDGLTREATAGVRLFVSGSAPLLAETFQAFQARTGHAILERYGMTETGMNTSNPLHGPRVPGSVGPPVPGVAVRVVEAETGRVLPQGEVGVLEVRGPNVFKGYWRMPEKTAEDLRPDGWFITGDVGRIDEAGYVHIVGRAKDLIITGGYNVYPKEVEAVVDAVPGVGESAVIGVPHPDFGEAVVAIATRTPNTPPPAETAVIDACRRDLANYKVPKRVIFVDELPRNAMGKVQKAALRTTHGTLFSGKGG